MNPIKNEKYAEKARIRAFPVMASRYAAYAWLHNAQAQDICQG